MFRSEDSGFTDTVNGFFIWDLFFPDSEKNMKYHSARYHRPVEPKKY